MKGTGILLRLALRRDRVLLPLWILVFVSVGASSAAATKSLYDTGDLLTAAARSVNATPALVALYGPVYDESSLGAIAFFKLIAFGAALVAVFSALVVIRHTRADEELGRTELAVSGAVSRHAPLAAALLLAFGSTLVLGLATALGVVAGGLDAAGSFALGLTWATGGFAFAGVAAVAAQLSANARAARGITIVVLVASYLLRAVGDVTGHAWISWLSPIGWSEQVRPFAGDRFWVALVPLAFTVGAVGVAVALANRRDLGSGLIAGRPGPASGSLGSAPALAFRQHRAAFLGWLTGFLVLGAVVGNLVTQLGSFLDSEQAQEMIRAMGGQSALEDAFVSAELGFMAVFASAYGISASLRMHSEETSGRIEPLLATSTPRALWLGSHLGLAALGATLLVTATGLAVGIAHALSGGGSEVIGRDLGGALVRLPAVWVVVALAALLYGLGNRLAPLAWGVLAVFLVLDEFGPLMNLPEWVQDLSPYSLIPQLPGGHLDWTWVLLLSVLAAAVAGLALGAFRRRDVAPG